MKRTTLEGLPKEKQTEFWATRCLEIVVRRLGSYPEGTNLQQKIKTEAWNMGFGEEKAQKIWDAVLNL